MYGNIGIILSRKKQIEKGIEYEKKALALKGYPNEARYRVLIHLDIFDSYLKLGDLSKAQLHLDSAIEGNKSLNNIAVSVLVANSKGVYYNAIKDIPKALDAYEESYRLK
ncbi:MAG: hypothetical protein WDO15_09660 [Bacteroidota bacterium]